MSDYIDLNPRVSSLSEYTKKDRVPECDIHNIIELVRWLSSDLKEYLLNTEIHPVAAESYLKIMRNIVKERVREFINAKYNSLEQIIREIESNIDEQLKNEDKILNLLDEFMSKNKQAQKEINTIMYAYNLAIIDIGNIIINKVEKYNVKNKEKYVDKLLKLVESAIGITVPQIILKILGLR